MQMFENFHPGFIFFLVGLFACMGMPKMRKMILACGPFLALVAAFNLAPGTEKTFPFLADWTSHFLYVDKLSWIFTFIFCIMGVIGGIFSCHNKSPLEALCSMGYVGASISVTLAHDWITFLFFWELMAATSLFLVWNDPRPTSRGAGTRYILMHTLSGNCVLLGVILKLTQGELLVQNLVNGPHDLAFWAILAGVAINVAMVPVHGWLVDAYPSATITGSVFMSSYTTKVAVYALLRIFGGTELLIVAGVLMALYGALYAVMENDMLKLLSYHIVSQVGYMVAGAGIGTVMSMNGATAHAFCDILFKSLLFMCCNAIIYATGVRKINQLGGMAHRYPTVFICFIVGGFSIAGIPLFNGFVSKTMTIAAAGHAGWELTGILLELASIGTLLSICFKMLYFIFLAPDKGIAKEERPIESNMTIAMITGAVLCTLYGCFPGLLYRYLPFGPVEYVPYTSLHVMQMLQMAFMAAIPFLLFLPRMEPHTALSLDTDWVYRKPLKKLFCGISYLFIALCHSLGEAWGVGTHQMMKICANPMELLDAKPLRPKKRYSPENYRTSIADTIMIVLTCLFICIFYFRLRL